MKDGFLICSNCGVIVADYTFSTDFEAIGFLTNTEINQALKIIDDMKAKEPDKQECDVLHEVKQRMNIINYLI